MKNPIAIGLGINQEDWKRGEVVVARNRPLFYHMLALVDWTENEDMIVMNWWDPSKLDFWTIDRNHKIEVAISFDDLPDGVEVSRARTGWLESLRLCLSGNR